MDICLAHTKQLKCLYCLLNKSSKVNQKNFKEFFIILHSEFCLVSLKWKAFSVEFTFIALQHWTAVSALFQRNFKLTEFRDEIPSKQHYILRRYLWHWNQYYDGSVSRQMRLCLHCVLEATFASHRKHDLWNTILWAIHSS